MAYTGMYRWTGYGFWPLCPIRQGYNFYVCRTWGVYFVICPKHIPKMKGVILYFRVFRALFCLKQGQGFKPETETWVKYTPPDAI